MICQSGEPPFTRCHQWDECMRLMIKSHQEHVFFDFALPECCLKQHKRRESASQRYLRLWLATQPAGHTFFGREAARGAYVEGEFDSLAPRSYYLKFAVPAALNRLVEEGAIAVQRQAHGSLNTLYRVVCAVEESV